MFVKSFEMNNTEISHSEFQNFLLIASKIKITLIKFSISNKLLNFNDCNFVLHIVQSEVKRFVSIYCLCFEIKLKIERNFLAFKTFSINLMTTNYMKFESHFCRDWCYKSLKYCEINHDFLPNKSMYFRLFKKKIRMREFHSILSAVNETIAFSIVIAYLTQYFITTKNVKDNIKLKVF